MNCIMYSILVNPTHAVTGALAPSSLFCGFIFSFPCDLIFFSFSLFLTPLWLCIGNRPVYLIDFAPLPPRFYRSAWARTPSSLCTWSPSPSFSHLPLPPKIMCLHSVSSVQRCTPHRRPYSRPLISTCGIPSALLVTEAGGPRLLPGTGAPLGTEKDSVFITQHWLQRCPSVFSKLLN